VVDRTITAAKIAMNDLVKTDLGMIDTTETIGTTGRIVPPTAATAPDHRLPVAPITTIVAPGLRPPGGRMIEGLQGTIMTVMTGGEVIMTERLILIMTDAGTIMIDPHVLGKTEDATRRMGVLSTKGPLGTEMAVGRAKIAHGFGTLALTGNGQCPSFGFSFPNLLVLVSTKIWR